MGDLLVMSSEWGLPNKTKTEGFLNKSHLHKILHDKFYIGVMSVKGVEYQHKYSKLIDNATFYKCQEVIAKANKQPFNYAQKPMLFRGMVTCDKYGCGYSWYEKRGHVYLRPNKKPKK